LNGYQKKTSQLDPSTSLCIVRLSPVSDPALKDRATRASGPKAGLWPKTRQYLGFIALTPIQKGFFSFGDANTG
jgi:hypothetical protein